MPDTELKDAEFLDNSEAFLKGEIPRLTCDSVEKRDFILTSLGAKPQAANYIGEDLKTNETFYLRKTSNPEISIEDRVPKDTKKPTNFYIYRKTDDN